MSLKSEIETSLRINVQYYKEYEKDVHDINGNISQLQLQEENVVRNRIINRLMDQKKTRQSLAHDCMTKINIYREELEYLEKHPLNESNKPQ